MLRVRESKPELMGGTVPSGEISRQRLDAALGSIEVAKTALEVGYAAAYAVGFSDALHVEKQICHDGVRRYREDVHTRCTRRLAALETLPSAKRQG
ncbi:hypothetical protein ACYZTX_28980 [Pseudomonas sp. MDT1-17]